MSESRRGPGPSLAEAIASVLRRGPEGLRNEIAPDREGGRHNPFVLDPVRVSSRPRGAPDSVPMDLGDEKRRLLDRIVLSGEVRNARETMESPFVRDTLAPLVRKPGHPDPVRGFNSEHPHLRPSASGRIGRVLGYYTPGVAPDTVALTVSGARQDDRGRRNTAAHEYGHALDHRGVNPELTNDVGAYYSNYRRDHPDEYGAASEGEHFAETFAEATEMLSREPGRAWHRRVRKNAEGWPESIVAMHHLLDTPEFRDHPQADRLRGLQPELGVLPAMRAQPPSSRPSLARRLHQANQR